jgi:hypothetical protein
MTMAGMRNDSALTNNLCREPDELPTRLNKHSRRVVLG